MKKKFLCSILIVVAMTLPACGKKEENLYLGEEIETEMPSDSIPEEAVTAKPKIVVSRSSDSTIPDIASAATPETTSATASESVPEPSISSSAKPETSPKAEPASGTQPTSEANKEHSSEDTPGISFNDDGSITVSQEILFKLAEEEKELIGSLGLTDKQVEILTTGGDITLSPELQTKLLDFLDTLSFAEKLRLLGKLAELIEN